MRGDEYKSVDKMNEIRTTKLEPMTNKVVMNHSDTLEDSHSAQHVCALPLLCIANLFMVTFLRIKSAFAYASI
jgi:hypothetical protein